MFVGIDGTHVALAVFYGDLGSHPLALKDFGTFHTFHVVITNRMSHIKILKDKQGCIRERKKRKKRRRDEIN